MGNRTARLAPACWRPALSVAALVSSLALCQGAFAQTVQVFEYTPPIEQLRSILIPESTGGASRRIIIAPSELQGASPIQAAAATPAPAPQPESSGASEAPSSAPSSGSTPAPHADATPDKPAAAPDRPSPQHASAAARPRPAAAAAPAPRQHEQAQGVVGFRINFALNSAAVPADADPFLDELAELLRQEPQVGLVVEGHTDAYGSDQYNLQLSELRAQAVTLALIYRGIAAERLSPIGKGKREPLNANPYDPNNRRVQFVRVDGART